MTCKLKPYLEYFRDILFMLQRQKFFFFHIFSNLGSQIKELFNMRAIQICKDLGM